MNPRIVGLTLAAVLVMGAAGSGLGAGGSAYVTSNCSYPKLQDNSIEQNEDQVLVWVKVTGNGVGDLYWETVNNPDGAFQTGDLVFQGCENQGPKYALYLAAGFDDSVLGSYTLTVFESANGGSVSGDGFRVVPD